MEFATLWTLIWHVTVVFQDDMLTVYCSPLRASLLQQKTMMHDDADVDDAAYDVRPTLVPAEDILVCTCIY